MNMRQHKRWVMARQMAMLSFLSGHEALGHSYFIPAPGVVLHVKDLEAAKQEFVCQRVKDGIVVDTFDTREDALALMLKHAKQRKAKLEVLDSSTGELVLFSEEEAVY